MNRQLCKQLAIDYCCTMEQVQDEQNHFKVYLPQEGRRRFQEEQECFLKIVSVNDKLLFTGKEEIIKWCEAQFKEDSGAWFMEAGTMAYLNREIGKYGYRIGQAHPFYIATQKTKVDTGEYEIVSYRGREIDQFRDDPRFDEAFAFCEDAPDEIGIAACRDGQILGMAGASSDSPYLWQIGINVMPEARGKNIGSMLVALVKNEVLDMGKLPYYGTAMSHIASQKVAIKAGFLPAWSELVTSPVKGQQVQE